MNVARVGIHKYSTANRNAAYEVHLARVSNAYYQATVAPNSRWKHKMSKMEWEEALRAWRVVQPTLFRQIYVSPRSTSVGKFLDRYPLLSAINWFIPGHYSYTGQTKKLVADFAKPTEKGANADTQASQKRPYPWFLPGVLVTHANKTSDRG